MAWNFNLPLSQNDALLLINCRIFAQVAQIMRACISFNPAKIAVFSGNDCFF